MRNFFACRVTTIRGTGEEIIMHGRILTFKGYMPKIGFQSRHSTPGAETILVEKFIDFYSSRFLRQYSKQNLGLFIEPKLESGFPDIVFAHYTPSLMKSSWTEARGELDANDLKVLSYLIQTGGSNGRKMINKLRFSGDLVLYSLEKLLAAKWVSWKNHYWWPSGLHRNFGLKKLVAIEAKINGVGKATTQALANTWFASHAYALTDAVHPHPATLASLSRLGVGLYCKGNPFHKTLDSRERSLPSSYASLLFNEWVAKSVLQWRFAS